MAITITDEYFKSVKNHLRISHNLDDANIKDNIEVAIDYIYRQLLLNPNLPDSTDKLTVKQKVAVRHVVAMLVSNPDGNVAINDRYKVVNTRLIRSILGNELRYIQKDFTTP